MATGLEKQTREAVMIIIVALGIWGLAIGMSGLMGSAWFGISFEDER